jgi:hypothetical protein
VSSDAAPAPETSASVRAGIERLEYRVERLATTLRFAYAFHTREVRFERDRGAGFERTFPETFAFRHERHDPTELYLQLEDLWTKPQLIAPRATRRDAEDVMARLVEALPAYLERVLDRLEAQEPSGRILEQAYEDTGMLALVVGRFLEDKPLDAERQRMAGFHLRRVALRAFDALLARRVDPEFLEGWTAGTIDAVDPSDDLTEIGVFYTLQRGEPAAVNRTLVRVAERSFRGWVEDVCLDPDNHAFETETSPFADRETEVLEAVCVDGSRGIQHSSDLVPFLRRPGNRDCMRILAKLERWFLRQYDVSNGAAVIHHEADLRAGRGATDRLLSAHGTRNYLLALAVVAAPFVGAALFYRRAPLVFDLWAAALVATGVAGTFWFFVYRFMWKRDLTFFHASVPRITAGIIVGYAPVFLIDEVWDLARSPWPQLTVVVGLLGFSTLLYLYVEVKSRIPDPGEAFERARSIFLLGLLQGVGVGLVITSLLGPFMAARNWAAEDAGLSVEWLQATAAPLLGQLPPVLGIGPFYAFPSAVALFTFLSFFIGTFLQLLWEDLPITEPM